MSMKPGTVAYIVRPWQRTEDIGRPVTLVRRGIRGERRRMRNGGMSECNGSGDRRAWLCDAHGGEFPCFVAEECLRPLGGNSTDTHEPANVDVPQAA